MDASEAEELTTRLWPDWLDNREKSKEWQRWALGRQDLPSIPANGTDEYQQIQRKAITPWLGLIVASLAQALIVEGYRTEGDEDSLLWSVWQANRMDAGQAAVYEAALTTGISYTAVLPTGSPRSRSTPMVDGEMPVPEWRPYSSAEMTAFYDSPHDDWPALAIAAEPTPMWRQKTGSRSRWSVTLFDDEQVHILDMNDGGTATIVDSKPHRAGVVPVIGFVNRETITGRAIGEIEPYVAVASRIDQDVFDRLIVQRFAAWRVRTATGLEEPDTEDGKAKRNLELLVSDLLVSSSKDSKFGSLPESPMDGHLRAAMEDVRMLAAVAQVPPTVLTGDLSNISAEALAAIESAYNRKVEQRKVTFGEGWERAFDLSGRIMGQSVDQSAQVRWRDMESRSMAQVADALGKVATMLEVPVEVLWDKLPFLTEQDRDRARDIRDAAGGVEALLAEIVAGQTSPVMEPAMNGQ